MGLAAPKRRSRIGNDPNNTRWTRDDSAFGRRILEKQGWKPGSYLGATDASHHGHLTDASKSHVRILLRDDNLGLGAKKVAENAETFGLNLFSGLLGRLNGKVEIKDERHEEAKRDVQLRLWQEGKYGMVRFVSAGFLVGEDVKALQKAEAATSHGKRKLAIDQEEPSEDKALPSGGSKRRKVVQVKHEDDTPKLDEPSSEVDAAMSRTIAAGGDNTESETVLSGTGSDVAEAKRIRKAEKAERRRLKEEKRERKACKAAKKLSKAQRRLDIDPGGEVQNSTTDRDVPNPEAPRVRPAVGGRAAVRRRYIQSKRLSTMDPKALNEIFMLKSSA